MTTGGIDKQSYWQLKAVTVWIILLVSTITAWHESSNYQMIAIIITIILALIKVILVIYSYMEVTGAARWLQILCGLWILIVFGVILFSYTMPGFLLQLSLMQ
ncbi:cytochrome C oxidase subunit IV family protein [Acinetobacter lactucae]|uniref:cytochrome C oxidase subunit IV family protein n=1 Tax=Acinetobacter lactucae TaxID=1785128 RepID=UPI0039F6A95A